MQGALRQEEAERVRLEAEAELEHARLKAQADRERARAKRLEHELAQAQEAAGRLQEELEAEKVRLKASTGQGGTQCLPAQKRFWQCLCLRTLIRARVCAVIWHMRGVVSLLLPAHVK